MITLEKHLRPCVVKGCKAPRAKDSSRCVEHRREGKAAAKKARIARQGPEAVHDEESQLLALIAFPEPDKYLAVIRSICQPRVDRRTIAGRQKRPDHQPLEMELEDNAE